MLIDDLKTKWATEGPERVGFVLENDLVVEVTNVHPQPLNNFDVPVEALIEFEDLAVATWHTHPGGTSQLSLDDDAAFRAWPDLLHYIVGSDGVRAYRVDGTKLVQQHVG